MHKNHHAKDQDIKDEIIRRFGSDQFIDESVGDGDINSNNTDETIMRTIREAFLSARQLLWSL